MYYYCFFVLVFSFIRKIKTLCKAICFWYCWFVALAEGALPDSRGLLWGSGWRADIPKQPSAALISEQTAVPWVTARFRKAALCHGNRHQSCWEHHPGAWASAVCYGIAAWWKPWSAGVRYQRSPKTGPAAIGWDQELEANAKTVANFSALSVKLDVGLR